MPLKKQSKNWESKPILIYFHHWDNGITQIGSRTEGINLFLHEINDGGLERTQLAVFSSLNVESGREEAQWCGPQSIFQLDVIDEWIILTAGEIQGSMRNFFGDLHRVKKDGGEREAFRLWSMNNRFVIIRLDSHSPR
ncbi:MAG: hypothetical protein FWE34_01105 [Defluviitaleaceae bacterium]|nr:hypothetical protein [Defluviitaleaceae bacterium]